MFEMELNPDELKIHILCHPCIHPYVCVYFLVLGNLEVSAPPCQGVEQDDL